MASVKPFSPQFIICKETYSKICLTYSKFYKSNEKYFEDWSNILLRFSTFGF